MFAAVTFVVGFEAGVVAEPVIANHYHVADTSSFTALGARLNFRLLHGSPCQWWGYYIRVL